MPLGSLHYFSLHKLLRRPPTHPPTHPPTRPCPAACPYPRVRWYVSSLGSEDAIHTAHWHGVVFNDSRGHHTDQVRVGPRAPHTVCKRAAETCMHKRVFVRNQRAPPKPRPCPPPPFMSLAPSTQVTIQSSSLEVLDMYADNPGTWLFHCHLNEHMDGGMMALFTVEGTAPAVVLEGKVRLGAWLHIGTTLPIRRAHRRRAHMCTSAYTPNTRAQLIHALHPQTRHYYIAAVQEEWDYAPFGGEMCGATLVRAGRLHTRQLPGAGPAVTRLQPAQVGSARAMRC